MVTSGMSVLSRRGVGPALDWQWGYLIHSYIISGLSIFLIFVAVY